MLGLQGSRDGLDLGLILGSVVSGPRPNLGLIGEQRQSCILLENLAGEARPTEHYIIYETLDYPHTQQWGASDKSQLNQNSSSECRGYTFLYILVHGKFKDITN